MSRFVAAIDRLSEWTGRAVAWLTLGMVVIGCLIVLLRYAFDTGWIWMQESITWMHALVFLLGAAYTLERDGHVRVDIFYRGMQPRAQALVDALGTLLLLLPTCAFLCVWSFGYVAASWSVREASREAGGLPGVFVLKTALPVMAVLLALQGIAVLLRSLRVLRGGGPAEPQPAHDPAAPL